MPKHNVSLYEACPILTYFISQIRANIIIYKISAEACGFYFGTTIFISTHTRRTIFLKKHSYRDHYIIIFFHKIISTIIQQDINSTSFLLLTDDEKQLFILLRDSIANSLLFTLSEYSSIIESASSSADLSLTKSPQ